MTLLFIKSASEPLFGAISQVPANEGVIALRRRFFDALYLSVDLYFPCGGPSMRYALHPGITPVPITDPLSPRKSTVVYGLNSLG
jgi:hypothetical protein